MVGTARLQYFEGKCWQAFCYLSKQLAHPEVFVRELRPHAVSSVTVSSLSKE